MATTIAATLPKFTVSAESVFGVTQLREFVTTALSDSVLQKLLDGAMLAIDGAIGPRADIREQWEAVPGDLVMLSRRAESITAVTENSRYQPIVLDDTDYELSPSGRVLRRLWTGTHHTWNWLGRVLVTYRPFDNISERIRVAVALVQLDLDHKPGITALQTEGYSETFASQNYQQERAALLASLTSGSALPI